jgi:hypothetical protein
MSRHRLSIRSHRTALEPLQYQGRRPTHIQPFKTNFG